MWRLQGVIDLTAFLVFHVPFKNIAIEKTIVMQGLNNLTGLTLDNLSLADSDDQVRPRSCAPEVHAHPNRRGCGTQRIGVTAHWVRWLSRTTWRYFSAGLGSDCGRAHSVAHLPGC